MLLHELAHVDAHHRGVVVEEILGQRLGQFGLAHAGGAEEQEAAERAVFIRKPCPRAADGLGHGLDRGALAHHAAAQLLLHLEKLFLFALQHLGRGNAGPAFHHLGDLFGPHRLGHQGLAFLGLGFRKVTLQRGDAAVLQFAGLGEVAFALGLLQFRAGPVKLLLQPARGFKAGAFGLPFRRQLGRFLLQVGKLLLQLFQPVARGGVVLFLQRLRLDLELEDLPVERVKLSGLLSTSIRRREAASSTRSMALSGRKRSVM